MNACTHMSRPNEPAEVEFGPVNGGPVEKYELGLGVFKESLSGLDHLSCAYILLAASKDIADPVSAQSSQTTGMTLQLGSLSPPNLVV
jgi:hypothetical protein